MKFLIPILISFATIKAIAASGGHDEGVPFVVVYQVINVALLVGMLYVLTRKKVRAYFSSRLETHEQAKKSAQRAFAEAQERHKEVTTKLQKLQAEEGSTIEKAQAEAMLLKSKLIQEAEALAANIVADAKKTAHYEYEKAKQELSKEAFEEALRLARSEIEKNLNDEDQKNLQRQFIDNIGTVQ